MCDTLCLFLDRMDRYMKVNFKTIFITVKENWYMQMVMNMKENLNSVLVMVLANFYTSERYFFFWDDFRTWYNTCVFDYREILLKGNGRMQFYMVMTVNLPIRKEQVKRFGNSCLFFLFFLLSERFLYIFLVYYGAFDNGLMHGVGQMNFANGER